MEALFRGSSHFLLEWGPPVDMNGILIGYELGYQKSQYFFSSISLWLKAVIILLILFVHISIFPRVSVFD